MKACQLLVLIGLLLGVTNAEAVTCPKGGHWNPQMGMCMKDSSKNLDNSSVTTNPTSFTAISKNVFQTSCTSCHMAMSPSDPPEGGIDLSSFVSLTASNESTTNPQHAPFIIAGDPEHSKLYLAVKNGDMPATEDGSSGTPLSPELVQNIYDWIKAGALNN